MQFFRKNKKYKKKGVVQSCQADLELRFEQSPNSEAPAPALYRLESGRIVAEFRRK